MLKPRLFSRRFWPIAVLYCVEFFLFLIMCSVAAFFAAIFLGYVPMPEADAMENIREGRFHLLGYVLGVLLIIIGVPRRLDVARYLWLAWVWSIWGGVTWGLIETKFESYGYFALVVFYPLLLTYVLFMSNLGTSYFIRDDETVFHQSSMLTRLLLPPTGYWIGAVIIGFSWTINDWLYFAGYLILLISFIMMRKTRRT